MDCEGSIYHKCGEIFLANQKNYSFLCCHCNELFHGFPEFKNHSLRHLITLDTADAIDFGTIESKKECCESVSDADNENGDILETPDLLEFKKEELGNIDVNKCAKVRDDIDTALEYFKDETCKTLNKETLLSNCTQEIPCPHCERSFNYNSHDIKKCSKIQETIGKFNGDFIKLLREGILCCCYCKNYFEDYKKLYEHHIKAKHCFQKDQCKICKFNSFMNSKINSSKKKAKILLKDDILETELDEQEFELNCEKCCISFNTKDEYDSHLNLIHKRNERNDIDQDNSDEDNNISSFDNFISHDIEELPFKCSFCERLFKKKSQMKTHMRIHTNHRPYKCNLCSSAFTVSANLKNHIVYKHTEDKPFVCEYEGCNARFKLYNLKKQHEKRHLPANFQCEICGNYYKTKFCLIKHQQSRHEDAKNWPHQCEICCKRFARSHHLVEHKRIHTGEKPFGCDLCPKFFRKRSALREHKKLHSDERKYVCRFCGKGFKQAAGYWGHMKRHPPLT